MGCSIHGRGRDASTVVTWRRVAGDLRTFRSVRRYAVRWRLGEMGTDVAHDERTSICNLCAEATRRVSRLFGRPRNPLASRFGVSLILPVSDPLSRVVTAPALRGSQALATLTMSLISREWKRTRA